MTTKSADLSNDSRVFNIFQQGPFDKEIQIKQTWFSEWFSEWFSDMIFRMIFRIQGWREQCKTKLSQADSIECFALMLYALSIATGPKCCKLAVLPSDRKFSELRYAESQPEQLTGLGVVMTCESKVTKVKKNNWYQLVSTSDTTGLCICGRRRPQFSHLSCLRPSFQVLSRKLRLSDYRFAYRCTNFRHWRRADQADQAPELLG